MEIKFLVLLLLVFVSGFAFSFIVTKAWVGQLLAALTGLVCIVLVSTLVLLLKKRFCPKRTNQQSFPENVTIIFNPVYNVSEEEPYAQGPIYQSNYSTYAGNLHMLSVHRFIGVNSSEVLENGEKVETEEITVQIKFDVIEENELIDIQHS